MSNLMDKVKAKVDSVLNKDNNEPKHTITQANLDADATNQNVAGRNPAVAGTNPSGTGINPIVAGTNQTGTHHAHHHHGHHGHHGHQHAADTSTGNYPAATTAGPTTGSGVGSTNTGPHDSNLMNKLDPRVDSDRDGKQNMGAASYGPGGAQNPNTTGAGYGSTTTGAGYGSNTTGAGYGSTTTGAGYGSTNTGPHDSYLMNKLDPRVDSDRDGSHNMGAASYGPGGAQNPNTGYANQGTGYNQTSNTNTLGGGAQTTVGPHSSDMMNKLDPRVDSDNDGSRNAGMAQTGQGATYNASTGPASATAGHHGSNLLNKLDPRVDSDASNNNVHGGVNAHTTAHNTNY